MVGSVDQVQLGAAGGQARGNLVITDEKLRYIINELVDAANGEDAAAVTEINALLANIQDATIPKPVVLDGKEYKTIAEIVDLIKNSTFNPAVIIPELPSTIASPVSVPENKTADSMARAALAGVLGVDSKDIPQELVDALKVIVATNFDGNSAEIKFKAAIDLPEFQTQLYTLAGKGDTYAEKLLQKINPEQYEQLQDGVKAGKLRGITPEQNKEAITASASIYMYFLGATEYDGISINFDNAIRTIEKLYGHEAAQKLIDTAAKMADKESIRLAQDPTPANKEKILQIKQNAQAALAVLKANNYDTSKLDKLIASTGRILENIAANISKETESLQAILGIKTSTTLTKDAVKTQVTGDVSKAFSSEAAQAERLQTLKEEAKKLEDQIIETNIKANKELSVQLQGVQAKAVEALKVLQNMVQGIRETIALMEKAGSIDAALVTVMKAQLEAVAAMQETIAANVERLTNAQDPVKAADPDKNKAFAAQLQIIQEAQVYADRAVKETQAKSALAAVAALNFITAAKTAGVTAVSKDYFIVLQLLKNIESQKMTEQTTKLRQELQSILKTYNEIFDDARAVQRNIHALEIKRNVNTMFSGLVPRADEDASWKVKQELDGLRGLSAHKNRHAYTMTEQILAKDVAVLSVQEMVSIFDKLPKAIQEQVLIELARNNPEKLIGLLKKSPVAAAMLKDVVGKLDQAQLVKLLETGALKLDQLPQTLRDKLAGLLKGTQAAA